MDMCMGPGSSCGEQAEDLRDNTAPSTASGKVRITSVEKVSFTVKENKRPNKPGPASKTGRTVSQKPLPVNTTGPSGSHKRKAMDLSTDSDTEVTISDDEGVDDDKKDGLWGFQDKQRPKPQRVCSTGLNGTLKRPQGRPTKTGEYVGLAEARRQAAKQAEICLRQTAERELIERERERRESRAIFTQKTAKEVAINGHDPDRVEAARKSLLLRQVSDAVATVEKIANKSSKLKGTYVKYLRDAAESISSASKQLGALTSSEEVTKLERENASLRAENSSLKETISRLQSDVEDIKKEIRGMAGKPSSPPVLVTPPSSSPSSEDKNEPPPRRYETRGSKGRLSSGGKGTPGPSSFPQTTPLPEDGFGDEMEVVDEMGSLPKSGATPPKDAPTGGDLQLALHGMMGEVIRQVGDMVSARLAVIEARLPPEKPLRPLLQVDKIKEGTTHPSHQKNRKRADAPPPHHPSTSGKSHSMALPPSKEGEWNTVKGRGKKSKNLSPPAHGTTLNARKALPQGPAPTHAVKKTPASYAETARMEKKSRLGTPKGPSRSEEPSQKKPGKPSSGPKAIESNPGQPKGKSPPAKPRKPPRRTAAVTITLPPNPEGQQGETKTSMAEVLKIAKEKIDLKEIGIDYLRPKRAITGALILEVPGEGSSPKADNLAAKLSQVVGGLGVKVARPVKCTELRVTKLDDAATCESIAQAIAELGGCLPTDIKVAPPRRAAQGLFAAWVRCPEVAAHRVAKAGKVKVGWAQARVELLKARPLQCYRCLEFGHTRQRCTATEDRGNVCYRCGQSGHLVTACKNAPQCTLCAGKGLTSAHRMGGIACPLAIPARKKKTARTPLERTARDRTTRDRTTRDTLNVESKPVPKEDNDKEKREAAPLMAQLPSPPSDKGDAKSPPNKDVRLEEAMDTTS